MNQSKLVTFFSFLLVLSLFQGRFVAAADPMVRFEPSPFVLGKVGDSGSLELILEEISRLGGFEFEITFDKDIIQIDTIRLLKPPAGTTVVPLGPNIDNENGKASFGFLSPEGNILTEGTTVLATIDITAKKQGDSELTFAKSVLLDTKDKDFSQIGVRTTVGLVQVGPTTTPTATPPPASTPTPTPTPEPGKASLTFYIKFQGIGQQRADKTVRFILKQDGQERYRFDSIGVTANQAGVYSGVITNLEPGSYDLYLKGWAHLQKKSSDIILNLGENIVDWSSLDLLAGDLNDDNLVEGTDLSLLLGKIREYNYEEIPPGIEEIADLNDDHYIEATDLSLLLSNVFKTGD